jgi:hypothetical protein
LVFDFGRQFSKYLDLYLHLYLWIALAVKRMGGVGRMLAVPLVAIVVYGISVVDATGTDAKASGEKRAFAED